MALLLTPGTIMAQQCLPGAPLILKETQSGIAGETGTVWTVAADCDFTIARQIGPKVLEPHAHGQLTSEQQGRLTGILNQFASAQFGSEPASPPYVNPHRISVTYGGREETLTLPPGRSGTAQESAGDRAKLILELASTIQGMLGR